MESDERSDLFRVTFMDALSFPTHRPNALTVETATAIVLDHAPIAEVRELGAGRIALDERRRPEASVRTDIAEPPIPAAPGGGNEYTITIGLASELTAIDTVLCRPLTRRVFKQLLTLGIRRHAPVSAPVNMRGIILGIQHSLVVDKVVITVR